MMIAKITKKRERIMTTKEFIENLNRDANENSAEILTKIQASGNDFEEIYAVAKKTGVTDGFEDFEAEMAAQYETAGYELTDEELAAVTGGAFGVVI